MAEKQLPREKKNYSIEELKHLKDMYAKTGNVKYLVDELFDENLNWTV